MSVDGNNLHTLNCMRHRWFENVVISSTIQSETERAKSMLGTYWWFCCRFRDRLLWFNICQSLTDWFDCICVQEFDVHCACNATIRFGEEIFRFHFLFKPLDSLFLLTRWSYIIYYFLIAIFVFMGKQQLQHKILTILALIHVFYWTIDAKQIYYVIYWYQCESRQNNRIHKFDKSNTTGFTSCTYFLLVKCLCICICMCVTVSILRVLSFVAQNIKTKPLTESNCDSILKQEIFDFNRNYYYLVQVKYSSQFWEGKH